MVTNEVLAKYEMTIGIECHVQLATATKLFSVADNDARDKSPNSVVSAVDFGLPGMLPVLNREAVNLAIKAAKALNAEVARVSRFDRKHYFYPDLPKGYQTTQMYDPIILEGYVDAPLEDGTNVRVRIHHAHMEEDAGKLTHFSDYSLVDLNRAGTPLIEIVSEPDIHSAAEAKAYTTELYRLMTYAGVTNGDLYHGNMRFDVNISVAPKGSTSLGRRAEVKNLNSFKSVEKAAEYEFRRQIEILERGEQVVQETRGWDDAKQKTSSQRSKEDAQDYRYMPDADIPPIILSDEEIAEIQANVPKLPPFYRESWKALNLDSTVVNALLSSRPLSELVQRILEKGGESVARPTALWYLTVLSDDLQGMQTTEDHPYQLPDEHYMKLAEMVDKGELNSTAAKEVFAEMIKTGTEPRDIAERKNLIQMSDEAAIAAIVDEVLADPASAKSLEDIRAGKDKAIGYLVGQIMKKSQGKANPALAQKMIRERL
ncbi:MAG TPA: Asp-tRNA(Asn)/Glu-tRNA(Gln) amidotransferase subunit GatB [Candidatus Saccharimonadales bacterium]|nr:Asp-tRNA(Asn)/Glu-tRNA(Gln) amidotransferase subunit GatB [Candidatus Saccharimonadales bacterium]